MVWQLPDVEEVAVVDPRVAPLLSGRQVASVFGLSVHLPHKPCKRQKYLEPLCSALNMMFTEHILGNESHLPNWRPGSENLKTPSSKAQLMINGDEANVSAKIFLEKY